ncbi:hypothetical protein ABTX99_13130 [Streptomyces flaveolus]
MSENTAAEAPAGTTRNDGPAPRALTVQELSRLYGTALDVAAQG